jgi:CheY-like chemotaxis protein
VKLLLIEDSEPVAKTAVMLHQLMDYEVKHVENGLDGLKFIEENQPDIAIIDIGLPDITGFEVAQRIRLMPNGDQVFLIALTGFDCKQKAEAAGFDCFFTKPMDFSVLPSLIAKRSRSGHPAA